MKSNIHMIILLLLVAIKAGPVLSSTITIIDTGPSTQNGGLVLRANQWLSGTFSIDNTYQLQQISTNYWGNGEELTFAIYDDLSLLPGAEISSFTVPTETVSTSQLNTLSFFLPDLQLMQGDYWAAFEVRAGQNFDGGLQGGWGGAFQNPLDNDAVKFGNNGTWDAGNFSSGGRIGLTIYASTVPIPPSILLFFSGLLILFSTTIINHLKNA